MVLADQTKEINEKKRLDELMNRYKSLFKNNSSIMLLIDYQNGAIVDVNDAALDFYGYDYKDMIQKNISEIVQLKEKEFHKELTNTKEKRRKYFNVIHHEKWLYHLELSDVHLTE
jgi:PAS domain S-box-containing protein